MSWWLMASESQHAAALCASKTDSRWWLRWCLLQSLIEAILANYWRPRGYASLRIRQDSKRCLAECNLFRSRERVAQPGYWIRTEELLISATKTAGSLHHQPPEDSPKKSEDYFFFAAFFAAFFMALCFSISYGIAAAFIFYCLVKVSTGKAKEIHPILWGATALFILNFIILAII